MTTTTQSEITGPFKVGDKMILSLDEYSKNAYKDQLGISHPGKVLKEVVAVTITHEKIVLGNYTDRQYKGYLAVADDGREFTTQWDRFDETSMEPYNAWHFPKAKDPEDILWRDAAETMNWGIAFPIVDKNGNLPSIPGIACCDKHMEKIKHPHWYQTSMGCLYCQCGL